MGSVRISIQNHIAAIIAQLIRSTLESAWGWPEEEWQEIMVFVERLEWRVDWSDPLIKGEEDHGEATDSS